MLSSVQKALTWLDAFFEVTKRGSTLWREARGGLVTFITMSYIVVLNPLILGFAKDANGQYLGGGTEPNLAAIAAATALVAGVMTILMGVLGNFPLALATGLGLNAFVAFGVASQMTWADAMGLIVLEGVVIMLLVLTGLREKIFTVVPRSLRVAISVGIGLFITLVGLVDAGVVKRIPDAANTTVPVQLGLDGALNGWPVLLFVAALLLLIALYVKKIKGAFLIAISVATVAAIVLENIVHVGSSVKNSLGWALNVPSIPDSVVASPVFSTFGQFNLFGSFESIGFVSALLLMFTLLLSDFFDTVGTVTAVGSEAGLLKKNGTPPKVKDILMVDSLAAIAGGAAGVSSNTSYIESTSGVAEGARTGFASVITGLLFLLAIFLAPLVEVIPSEAAVPALILVGFLMMTQIGEINWKKPEVGIPAFLVAILMPFTYSISVGIGAGFVSYVFIKWLQGKAKDVDVLLWVVAVLFVIYFAIRPLTDLLT